MRPENHELDSRNFPFSVELATRYGDTDMLRHVNNVAIARLFEEARVRFGIYSKDRTFDELAELGATVTASVLINYLAEVFYPDPVTVAVGVDHIGRTSYTLSCLMQQNGRPVAYNKTTLVYYADGKSAPIPQSMVEVLKNFGITHPS